MTKTTPLWHVASLQGVRLRDLRSHNTVTTEAALNSAGGIHLHYEALGVDDPQASQVIVTVKLSLHLGQADDAPESTPLFITARYEAIYGRPPSFVIVPNDLQDFAQNNAMLNVWPQWRELTRSLFGRMDLALPPIPHFRVPNPTPSPPSPTQAPPTR
jgi:hypothetical protein